MNRESVLSPHPPVPAPSGLFLQRKCDCGQHTMGGGRCSGGREKQEMGMQRSRGESLDAPTFSFVEPRIRRDFSLVPTHATGQATRQGIPPIASQRQTADAKRNPELPNPDDFLKLLIQAYRNTYAGHPTFQLPPQRHGIIPPIPSASPLFKQLDQNFSMRISPKPPWGSDEPKLNLLPLERSSGPGVGFDKGYFRFFVDKADENNSPGGSPPPAPPLMWIPKRVRDVFDRLDDGKLAIRMLFHKRRQIRPQSYYELP